MLCSAFAVATSILAMQLTLTLHPPGGATALIAVIGSNQIHELGFLCVGSRYIRSSYFTCKCIDCK